MSELAMKVIKWQTKGEVGISSATMAAIALGLNKPFYGSYFREPSDPADLRRCMILVDTIPEIRDHFPAIAKKVKTFAPILDNWDKLISLLKKEMASGNRAPETYAAMKALRID